MTDAARLALVTCTGLPEWEVDDRRLHESLERRGVAFDRPAWTDDAVDWASYDLALLRTPWDYQERLPEFLTWLDRTSAVTTVCNPPAVLRWNARKTYLRDLAEAGLPTIPTAWFDADDPDSDTVAASPAAILERARAIDSCAETFFLKPQVGATAWGTLPFAADHDGATEAAAHLRSWLARPGIAGMMLQPFVPSVGSFGETSVLFVEGEAMHGVRKVPVPGDYRVQDDFGASDERWEPPEAALEVARAAMAAGVTQALGPSAGPLLYGRVDFLRDDDAARRTDGHGHWRIVELELIEPSLFLRHGPETAERLADAIVHRLA